jgi:hypothetical protein
MHIFDVKFCSKRVADLACIQCEFATAAPTARGG